jgi:hypothetical protein
MSIGLEALIVSVFLILPGFTATLVQRSVQFALRGVSDEMQVSATTWAAISLIRGLAINFIAAAIFVLFIIDIDLAKQVKDLRQFAIDTDIRTLAWYIATLYGLAALWGGLTGVANKFELLRGSYLRGWTDISPFPDVWNGAISEFFPGNESADRGGARPVPWAVIKMTEGPLLVGRLHGGNVQIDKDKPFEVVLRHAFHLDDGRARPLAGLDGLDYRATYLRITPEMQVHILSGPDSWRPTYPPPDPPAEPPPKTGFRFLGGSFYCEGVGERGAHPGVFIPIDGSGSARCTYCNQAFAFGPQPERSRRPSG